MITDKELIVLMSSSKSEKEWEENSDLVKEICGGELPKCWLQAIVLARVMEETKQKYGW